MFEFPFKIREADVRRDAKRIGLALAMLAVALVALGAVVF